MRLAAVLDMPVNTVQDLLHTSYDSYISQLSEDTPQSRFSNYLEQILDYLDQSDFSTFSLLHDVILSKIPNSVILKSNYSCWYEALNLAFQEKFESAISLFIEASGFTPRYDIEKRFMAKILGGLGAAYLVRGKYSQSMKAFRQSLFLWPKGFQEAWVYMNLGTLYRRLGRYELSVSAYQHAYKFGTSATKLYGLVGLIQLSLDKKDYRIARKYVLMGYSHAKTLDSPRGKCDIYCNIAEYYFTIGQLHRSELYFQKAITLAAISGDNRTKHWAGVELAVVLLEQGLVKEFDDLIQTLESELLGYEDVLLVAKHLNMSGQKYHVQCEYWQVVTIADKTYKLLTSLSPHPSTEFKVCCELLYKAYIALNNIVLADFYLNEMNKFKG